MHLHVPVEATRVLDPEIVNTQDESASDFSSAARRLRNSPRESLFTSKAHTLAAFTQIWNKTVGADPALIVRYARDDPLLTEALVARQTY